MQEKKETAPEALTLDEAVYVSLFGSIGRWRRRRLSFSFLASLETALGALALQRDDDRRPGETEFELATTEADFRYLETIYRESQQRYDDLLDAIPQAGSSRPGTGLFPSILSGTVEHPDSLMVQPRWARDQLRGRYRRYEGLVSASSLGTTLRQFQPVLLQVRAVQKRAYDNNSLLLAWLLDVFLESKLAGWRELSNLECHSRYPKWFNCHVVNMRSIVTAIRTKSSVPELTDEVRGRTMHDHVSRAVSTLRHGWSALQPMSKVEAARFHWTTLGLAALILKDDDETCLELKEQDAEAIVDYLSSKCQLPDGLSTEEATDALLLAGREAGIFV